MSELDRIKAKIEATEDELRETKSKLAEAERDGKSEKYLISLQNTVFSLQNTLVEQQKEKNILLAQSVPATPGKSASYLCSYCFPYYLATSFEATSHRV